MARNTEPGHSTGDRRIWIPIWVRALYFVCFFAFLFWYMSVNYGRPLAIRAAVSGLAVGLAGLLVLLIAQRIAKARRRSSAN